MNLIYSPESNYSLLYILWDMLSWRALVIIAMLAIVNWLYDNRFKMAIPEIARTDMIRKEHICQFQQGE
ncbi:hypothetical protein C9J45_12680 [Photobacterium sp. GB-1]|nr:hypothetical protein C9J45_12680 [Photobacterium sp. GB-1]